MARSKLRKSNSALSRGQMVRIENRFTLRLEEDTYDPDEIGACCTANSDDEKCVCADNVTARDCCLQKGDFFPGISCDANPCPCVQRGACCVPCANDEAVFGICFSNRTQAECTALGGGKIQIGVDCETNNPCPECNDNTIYEAKIACCEPCPEGTNTGRNGTCVVYTGTGTTPAEAEENARSQCTNGTVGIVTTGEEGGAANPCDTDNGTCEDCNTKKRPYCLFCPQVDDTECGTTKSGECIEVEVDFSGTIIDDPGTGVGGFNPAGNLDLLCSDLSDNQLCSGTDSDCDTCQEVCCCQNGNVGPVQVGTCTGETIFLEPGQGCNNDDVVCLFDNYCVVCDSSICDASTASYSSDPVSGACIITIDPEYQCRVINTNEGCGDINGVDAPQDALDEPGAFDCAKYGGGFDPSAGGDGGLCGCPDCELAAIAAAATNPITGQCPINNQACLQCASCPTTVQMSGEFAGCYDTYQCCFDAPPDPSDPFGRCDNP